MDQKTVDLDWYKRTMLDGRDLPDGVTINPDDHRADQRCTVCDELVDAWGYPFTAQRCNQHLDDIKDWIMAQVPVGQTISFAHLGESVRDQHPALSYGEVQARVWLLLSEGDLKLTESRKISR